jgi:hypothetical protein
VRLGKGVVDRYLPPLALVDSGDKDIFAPPPPSTHCPPPLEACSRAMTGWRESLVRRVTTRMAWLGCRRTVQVREEG